ncbi:MAG: hypothetical protein IPO63_01820 [Bacteroidetes bacterium]|nr:hypothetical protein [Bacteroidota bacterium]
MKNLNTIKLIASTILLIGTISSCKKDKTNDPQPINQSELITKVQLVFVDSISGAVASISTFSDVDGPGGVATQDSILLNSNTTYLMNLILLDETKSPVDTISNEVLNEGDVHLFVFNANPSGFLTTNITDLDANLKPIGLSSILRTSAAGVGTYSVELRHFTSEQAKADNLVYDTDISILFNVRLQ